MKKKPSPISSILWLITTALWIFIFVLDLCEGNNSTTMLILHAACVLISAVCVLVNYKKYKKDKAEYEKSLEENDSETDIK